jgi:ComF family protein
MSSLFSASTVSRLCMPLLMLADWLYASGCVICGRQCADGLPICAICRRRLPRFPHPLCPVCGRFVLTAHAHRDCLAETPVPSLVWMCGIFDAGYRPLVHALKYEHQQSIGEFFGRRLGRQLRRATKLDDDPPVIIPVPLHPSREKTRGYNQSTAIAKGLDRATGLALETGILRRVRRTRDHTHLTPARRLANVRDAFAVRHGYIIRSRRVILVDDVMTTGATLNECTRVLFAEGVAEVQAAVIALARPATRHVDRLTT